jgi:hypothetical protein
LSKAELQQECEGLHDCIETLRELLLKRIARERLVKYPGPMPKQCTGKVVRSQLEEVLDKELAEEADQARRGED